MLAIRLTRQGAKKRPFYRIIVTEKRSKRDGRFIEILGHYNPLREPIELKLDQERVAYWMKCGAQPSDTVRGLIRKSAEMSPAVEPVAAASTPAPVMAEAPTPAPVAVEPTPAVSETASETAAE